MVMVVSHQFTVVFPDLELRLPAGVPTAIPDEQREQVLSFPGVELLPSPEPPPIHPTEEA